MGYCFSVRVLELVGIAIEDLRLSLCARTWICSFRRFGGMIFATRFGGGASRGKKGLVCCGGGSVTVECGWSDENQCKRLTETSILQVVSECCS